MANVAGKLLIKNGASTYLLGNFNGIEIATSVDGGEDLTGHYMDVSAPQVLEVGSGTETVEVTINIPKYSSQMRSVFNHKSISPETLTRELVIPATFVTNASGTTTYEMPVGAVLQQVRLGTLGADRKLALTTDYTVSGQEITINAAVGSKVLIVAIYTLSRSLPVTSQGTDAINRADSKFQLTWVAKNTDGTYTYCGADSAAVTEIPTINFGGEGGEQSVKFKLEAVDGATWWEATMTATEFGELFGS